MIITYLKTIFYSFYFAPAYMDAFKNWRGYGIKYLLIVTTLSSSLIVFWWSWDLSKISPRRVADNVTDFILSEPDLSFDENISRFLNILSQIPEIRIENGALVTSVPQPFAIVDPVSGYDIAIIDTTGKSTSLDGTDAVLLLTNSKIVTVDEGGYEKVTYFHDLEKRYNIDEGSLNETLFIISQIPPFGLHNGKFITEGNKLYKIVDKKDRILAEIGQVAMLGEKMEPMIAISTNEINYKSILNKTGKTIEVADLNEMTLFELILSGITTIRNLLLLGAPIIALPFIIAMSFLFNGLMLVFYTFIGHSFIKIMKLGQFEYKDIMRVAVVAITPMLLVSTILPKFIPSQGTVYFLVSVGYLYFAIKHITAQPQK